MSTQTIIILVLALYVLSMLGIGLYTSRKTKSVSDFVLGGQNAGSWLTAFAYGTSYFSAVVFIGYAGQFGYNYGVSAAWIGVGNAILGSLLAWVVLGKRTRIMTKHLGSKTMPEYFEGRFQSKSLKIAAAVIVFVFLIPYTASVYNGLSRLFSMAFGLTSESSYQIIIIAMALLTAVYVILGGYTATAINDFVQGIIMLAGICAVVYCVVNNQGGFSQALDSLAAIPDDKGNTGTLNSLFGPDPINLFGVVVLTSLGTWGLPQMVHKFYAIKDQDAVKKGTIISTLFALVVAGGSYLMGGFDRLFCVKGADDGSGRTAVGAFDEMVPAMLETALPDLLIGLVVVLVLSASMSTLSSLVLTSSSTLTIDLIKPMAKKAFADKKELLIMRVLIAVFLVVSVLIAFNKTASITTLMSYSWGALAGAFLGPFMWGLFSKKVTCASVWVSFILGIGGTIAHMLVFSFFADSFPSVVNAAKSFPLNLASPINAGAILMILSIILVPLVSMFTKQCDAKAVDEVFRCFDETESEQSDAA